MSYDAGKYDVAVIGAGHAGIEAALASARLGCRTVIFTINMDAVGNCPCNPSIGGTAKGHLVREVDALGGEMGKTADECTLQSRMLNLGKGPAVHSLRAQIDRNKYARVMKHKLEQCENLVMRQAEVIDIERGGENWLLTTRLGAVYTCRAVVLATGGVSYPSTGSTGDGYLFAKENGLSVTKLSASLVGLTMDEKWPTLLQGLSLKNVRITAKVGKKTIYSELGEMLFTHFGVSGPLMIELSSHAPEDFSQMAVTLDMKPGLTEEQVDLRLQRDFAENIRKQLSSVLTGLMPARMAPVFAKLCGVDADTPINQVTREQRLAIGRALKALPLRVVGTRPIEEAIVTRGGVDVLEITPGTMMSKKTPGLFFAGEVLDVDAHTGGFNLQIAFSTGALAGKSAAAWTMER